MIEKRIGGEYCWYIPDGFFPPTNSPGHYVSHEAICVLNAGKADAHINITLYFEDREPMKDFIVECKAERTNHIRMDKLKDTNGKGVPKDAPYAMMVESDQLIIVQYSRLDTTQAEMSLMTTMAYPFK